MNKIFIFLGCVTVAFASAAQDTSFISTSGVKPLSFTAKHSSFSLTYGVTAPFGLSPVTQGSTATNTKGSYTLGPVEALYHMGLSNKFSLQLGLLAMFHKDAYQYPSNNPVYTIDNYTNLVIGGGLVGFNYHFISHKKLDPYIGFGTGVAYFWGTHGANDLGLRSKNKTLVIFNPKVGMRLYQKKNAWMVEGGYDNFSYLKVGYSIVKRR